MFGRTLFQLACGIALSGLLASGAAAQENPVSLEVFPEDVNLNTLRDRQSFVVQAAYANGITRDVTKEAKLTLTNAAPVKIDGNVIHPAADGSTELKVEFGTLSKTIPIKVEKATTDRPVSFKLDVMPVFMKANCNTGSCHGAARGKDGFRLSLFGFDPNGDHFRLTRGAAWPTHQPGHSRRQPSDDQVSRLRSAYGRKTIRRRH